MVMVDPPIVTVSAPPMVQSTTMKVAADSRAEFTPARDLTGESVAIPLLARALLPRRYALADAHVPLEALAAWQANAAPPDEARQLAGPLLDVDALLALPATTPADLTPLWRAHTRELQDLLAEAIARGGDARHDALAALDSRPDGPALGALTPDTDAALGAGHCGRDA